MTGRTRALANPLVALAVLVVAAGCAGSTPDGPAAPATTAQSAAQSAGQHAGKGVRVVSTSDARAILQAPPPGLVVLDVRTDEEFAEGHIEGAIMLDFYRPDFADQLATLDPDVPYLLYCRSGNRSSQVRAMMEALGFTDVADIDGGILAWTDAGLPVVGS